MNLAYHWLDRKRQMVVFDGLRTPLPRDLGPGESVTLRATIRAPEKAGEYLLHMTMIAGSSRMVFRQRWGLCLNIGFVN